MPRPGQRKRSAPPRATSARAAGRGSRGGRNESIAVAGDRDDRVANAARVEKGEARGCAEQHGAFRVHLAAQGEIRDDGDLGQVGFDRHSGIRIDQVMHRLTPSAPSSAAGAYRTVSHRHGRVIAQPDMPAVAVWSVATYPDVAAEVADGIVTELIDEDIGEGPLGAPTQGQPRPRSRPCTSARLSRDA